MNNQPRSVRRAPQQQSPTNAQVRDGNAQIHSSPSELQEAAEIISVLVADFERIEDELHDGLINISVLGSNIKRALNFLRRIQIGGDNISVRSIEEIISTFEIDVVSVSGKNIELRLGDKVIGRIVSEPEIQKLLQ